MASFNFSERCFSNRFAGCDVKIPNMVSLVSVFLLYTAKLFDSMSNGLINRTINGVGPTALPASPDKVWDRT